MLHTNISALTIICFCNIPCMYKTCMYHFLWVLVFHRAFGSCLHSVKTFVPLLLKIAVAGYIHEFACLCHCHTPVFYLLEKRMSAFFLFFQLRQNLLNRFLGVLTSVGLLFHCQVLPPISVPMLSAQPLGFGARVAHRPAAGEDVAAATAPGHPVVAAPALPPTRSNRVQAVNHDSGALKTA